MNTKEYLICNELKSISLKSLYDGNKDSRNTLKYNIECLVNTESPISLSLFNKRIRESLGVKKVSKNLLDIFKEELNNLGYIIEENDFDPIIWTESGKYKLNYFRVNSQRTLYQIEKSELKVLIDSIKEYKDKNDLYHKILNELGYEVLTSKALKYLDYVVED